MHSKINDFILSNNYSQHVTIKFEKINSWYLYKNLNFKMTTACLSMQITLLNDLKNFIIKHRNRPKSCLASMMVFETCSPSSCGIVKMNRNKILTKYTEKPKHFIGRMANSAIIILSKELIQILSESKNKMNMIFARKFYQH